MVVSQERDLIEVNVVGMFSLFLKLWGLPRLGKGVVKGGDGFMVYPSPGKAFTSLRTSLLSNPVLF